MMIAQSFDLFGTPDAPVTTAPRTQHQAMLFAGDLFAHVDPNTKPAAAPDLDPALHDTTIDDLTDDGFAFAGLSAAEVAAMPAAEDDPPPANRKARPTVIGGTRRVDAGGERDFRYVGLVRYAGRRGVAPIITECGHEHTNRDWSTGAAGGSARDCARQIIAGARNPATAQDTARRLRNAPVGLANGAGFIAPVATLAGARATAEANAGSYLAAVAAVRAYLRGVTVPNAREEATTAAPGREPGLPAVAADEPDTTCPVCGCEADEAELASVNGSDPMCWECRREA